MLHEARTYKRAINDHGQQVRGGRRQQVRGKRSSGGGGQQVRAKCKQEGILGNIVLIFINIWGMKSDSISLIIYVNSVSLIFADSWEK